MMFPYVYFSYTVVETLNPDNSLIAQIVSHAPATAPCWGEAPDLWLQRKAALTLFDTNGLDAFFSFYEMTGYGESRRLFTLLTNGVG
jgi:hypothetical protein